MSNLQQHFYVHELPNGEEDGMPLVEVVVDRITWVGGERPTKLDIPGWRGWLDELVMQGKHPF